MNNNIYVLDTSVLIDNPKIVHELKGLIVIPTVVIKQLDGLKNSDDIATASQARRASWVLDALTAKGDCSSGIPVSSKATLKLVREYTHVDTLDNSADNKIIGTAEMIGKEYGKDRVTLLTTDVNMRVAARERGIKAADVFDVIRVLRIKENIRVLRIKENIREKIKIIGLLSLVVSLISVALYPTKISKIALISSIGLLFGSAVVFAIIDAYRDFVTGRMPKREMAAIIFLASLIAIIIGSAVFLSGEITSMIALVASGVILVIMLVMEIISPGEVDEDFLEELIFNPMYKFFSVNIHYDGNN